MLALCSPNFCCLYKVCSDVSEAPLLAICVRLCSCLCIVCSNVSEAFMLAICVRFCSWSCKICSRVSEALLLAFGLCLCLSSLTLPQTVRLHCVLRLPNSSTPYYFPFLRCEGMANHKLISSNALLWAYHSQTHSTIAVHCTHFGITL